MLLPRKLAALIILVLIRGLTVLIIAPNCVRGGEVSLLYSRIPKEFNGTLARDSTETKSTTSV